MSLPIGLQVLRAKVRGFQAAGATISSLIRKSEKERKNRLWNEKRALGNHARNHLVAYGLLRGVPYHSIERCAPNNPLNPQHVLDIVLLHNGWDPKMGYVRYDLEMVKGLLEGKVGRWVMSTNSARPVWVLESPQAALESAS